MFKKMMLGAAIASQVLAGAAYAAPARPQAVSFDSVKTVDAAGSPARIGSATKRKNDIAGVPFLLPLLGVVALVAVVAVVASGGDDDSSPN
ncbi:hypothetical protein [Sphingomonas sp. OK281]|uniref:hypothetical protein n=1 Tax=Sphingomonas sp. OK281 TaxID=1881067 RepID=UPI0008F3F125|nr:hypothetical protein [Sphingomonas sp. OK281]SFO29153.1 hypothetical protein SAMN05428984_3258 [Sphingomonas sp. OK281]